MWICSEVLWARHGKETQWCHKSHGASFSLRRPLQETWMLTAWCTISYCTQWEPASFALCPWNGIQVERLAWGWRSTDAPIVSVHTYPQRWCVVSAAPPRVTSLSTLWWQSQVVSKLFQAFNNFCTFENVKFNPELEKVFFCLGMKQLGSDNVIRA